MQILLILLHLDFWQTIIFTFLSILVTRILPKYLLSILVLSKWGHSYISLAARVKALKISPTVFAAPHVVWRLIVRQLSIWLQVRWMEILRGLVLS